MERFETVRRVLNRASEPLRSDEPEPEPPDEAAVEQVADCLDSDDPFNT